jgi:glycosyltransferase involved in cell wall biosynthesis
VLTQETNFTWELIIADDFSTDGTREILFEYQQTHPDLIRLLPRTKHLGAGQNWLELFTVPRSKYIAYLEGDDYWLTPHKLQKQVNFLEAYPEYHLCYASYLFDGVLSHAIHSSSILFRNTIQYPESILLVWNGDTFFYVLSRFQGRHQRLDFVGHFRRRHAQSTWSSKALVERLEKAAYSHQIILQYIAEQPESDTKRFLEKGTRITHAKILLQLGLKKKSVGLVRQSFVVCGKAGSSLGGAWPLLKTAIRFFLGKT